MAAETHSTPAQGGIDLHYGHPRMPLSERAKIFVPFDPLKGFREALEEQERRALEGQEGQHATEAAKPSERSAGLQP